MEARGDGYRVMEWINEGCGKEPQTLNAGPAGRMSAAAEDQAKGGPRPERARRRSLAGVEKRVAATDPGATPAINLTAVSRLSSGSAGKPGADSCAGSDGCRAVVPGTTTSPSTAPPKGLWAAEPVSARCWTTVSAALAASGIPDEVSQSAIASSLTTPYRRDAGLKVRFATAMAATVAGGKGSLG